MGVLRKLYTLLTVQQRRQATVLLVLMLIGTILETLSIGLVIPAFALMIETDVAVSYPQLQPLLHYFGNPTQKQLITGGILALLSLYLVKAIFLAFLTWRQNAFVFGARGILSQRLFASYLRQPWTFHLQRNSAQLINILTNETNQFTSHALQPAFSLLAEGIVFLGICTLLIVAQPLGALLVIGALGLAAWGFHKITRGYLLRWGQDRQYHEGMRVQHVQQGLGGAKEIKLLGREADFLAQYGKHNLASVRAVGLQNTLQQLPRMWIELLAVAGLAILILAMLEQGKPIAMVLPMLAMFTVAALRLIPSVNRIVGSLQSLRYVAPVINTLHQEMQLLDAAAVPRGSALPPFRHGISLEHVSYHYPDTEKPVLLDVNLRIPFGASVGFVGGSGAGKSTLVDVILGLLSPIHGHVKIDGIDIQINLRSWQDQIGYVPQNIFLSDDSLRRNIAFGLADDQIDDAAVHRALQSAQLEEFVSNLPQGWDTVVGERGVRLSGGQRQRIGIARALYHDPAVLVLDEATSALDTVTEQGVMDAVNALVGNKTILIVAHRLSTIARCDQLYRLEGGMLAKEEKLDSVLQKLAVNANNNF